MLINYSGIFFGGNKLQLHISIYRNNKFDVTT